MIPIVIYADNWLVLTMLKLLITAAGIDREVDQRIRRAVRLVEWSDLLIIHIVCITSTGDITRRKRSLFLKVTSK